MRVQYGKMVCIGLIQEENKMVYFLISNGRAWYEGEEFWIFESYIPRLIKVLDLLNHTAFLDNNLIFFMGNVRTGNNYL